MAHWLLKEEPTHYSWTDLVRDGRTTWNGVHNALALRHLRSMAVGDTAFYYHSGVERAVVGILEIASPPRPDPDDRRGSWEVDVRPVRPLRRPVGLTEMREETALAGFDLLRISRLSIVPVSASHWRTILAHADRAPGEGRVTAGRGGSRQAPAPRRPGAARPRRR